MLYADGWSIQGCRDTPVQTRPGEAGRRCCDSVEYAISGTGSAPLTSSHGAAEDAVDEIEDAQRALSKQPLDLTDVLDAVHMVSPFFGIPYFTIFVGERLSNYAKAAKMALDAKKAGALRLLLFWFFDFVYFCFWLVFCATSIAGKRRDVFQFLILADVAVVSSDAPCQLLVFVLPRRQFARVDADQFADGALDLHTPVLFPLLPGRMIGRFAGCGRVYHLFDYLRLVV